VLHCHSKRRGDSTASHPSLRRLTARRRSVDIQTLAQILHDEPSLDGLIWVEAVDVIDPCAN
jgi:hypothetical protein